MHCSGLVCVFGRSKYPTTVAWRRLQTAADGLLVISGTLQEEHRSSNESVQLGPTNAPIIMPKAVRDPQHETGEESSSKSMSRRRDGEQHDREKPAKRQKTKQKPQKESSKLMEQKLLEVRYHCHSNGIVSLDI